MRVLIFTLVALVASCSAILAPPRYESTTSGLSSADRRALGARDREVTREELEAWARKAEETIKGVQAGTKDPSELDKLVFE
jgi:uncharacterized protein involved in exopolysaccharide biosynthesis